MDVNVHRFLLILEHYIHYDTRILLHYIFVYNSVIEVIAFQYVKIPIAINRNITVYLFNADNSSYNNRKIKWWQH